MLGVDPKWVHPLPLDVPTVLPNTGGVEVTLIEANHCELARAVFIPCDLIHLECFKRCLLGPGSALFLFDGLQTINAGDSEFHSPWVGSPKRFRYLHCGDFRASPRHTEHPAVKGKKLDLVYLDTTYLDPKVSRHAYIMFNWSFRFDLRSVFGDSTASHLRRWSSMRALRSPNRLYWG